jgi:biotin carboxyl carrier protein
MFSDRPSGACPQPMKLNATIGNYETDVQLQREGCRVRAEIEGRRYELEVHESGPHRLLIVSEGRVFDCRVDGRPASGTTIDVVVGTTEYAVALTDPRKLSSAASASSHNDGAARIIASMPGKVVRILVAVGDRVEAGAGIVVVEAMKMQNEMKSPKAGTVVAFDIQAGATVNGGDVLAVIE